MKVTTSNTVSFPRDTAAAPGTESALWPGTTASTRERRQTPPARLTPRQLEVLALLCEGLPNKLICRRLNIATGTVKVHISCILRELGVESRLQAVVAARRSGLLGDPGAGTAQQAAGATPAGQPMTAARYGEDRASQRAAVAA